MMVIMGYYNFTTPIPRQKERQYNNNNSTGDLSKSESESRLNLSTKDNLQTKDNLSGGTNVSLNKNDNLDGSKGTYVSKGTSTGSPRGGSSKTVTIEFCRPNGHTFTIDLEESDLEELTMAQFIDLIREQNNTDNDIKNTPTCWFEMFLIKNLLFQYFEIYSSGICVLYKLIQLRL